MGGSRGGGGARGGGFGPHLENENHEPGYRFPNKYWYGPTSRSDWTPWVE